MVKDPFATIDRMRIAGRIAADALVEVGRHVAPGITTDELDRIGHDFVVACAALYPSAPSATARAIPSRCARA